MSRRGHASPIVREIEPGDRRSLAGLLLRANAVGERQCPGWLEPQALAKLGLNAPPVVFVCSLEHDLLGVARLFERVEDQSFLDGPYVEPNKRKQHLATLLVEHAVIHAAAQGFRFLHLTASRQAAGFFRRLGFEGMPSERPRTAQVDMCRQIGPLSPPRVHIAQM